MIGIGSVGGKTLGMLVSRAVLRDRAPDLAARLEVHDPFFVGAEVFVSFLVENEVWWIREKQRRDETFLHELDEGRRRILAGGFPPLHTPTVREHVGLLRRVALHRPPPCSKTRAATPSPANTTASSS